MFSCQIKTSVFPHLIRFLGKLVKLKLKTSCNKTMNSVHFMPRDYMLMTITSSKQYCSMLVVSKFKLREKERQHSHGNFGRMLGGFYNFFFSKLVDRMLGILCMLYCRVVL